MVDKRIGDLTAVVTPAGTDELASDTGGVEDEKYTLDQIAGYATAGLTIGSDVQAHSAVLDATTASYTTAEETKLAGIEAGADVTDAVNVLAALDGATIADATPVSGDKFLIKDASAAGGVREADYDDLPGAAGGLTNIVEDTTPQLGGNLDLNTFDITGKVIGTDVQAHSAVLDATTASYTAAEETKLAGVAAGADVSPVASVNTATGAVVLDADDIADAATTNKFATAAELAAIATNTATANAAAVDYVTPVEVTGTTDTLTAADHAVTNWYSNAALVTVTLPTDAAEDLPDGFWCLLVATGAGGLTLSTTGVTVAGSAATTVATGEGLIVQKTGTANTWIVLGGTS